MKCYKCGVKIKNTQYTGLGQYEKVCALCSKDIIKSKLPQMREEYLKEENHCDNYKSFGTLSCVRLSEEEIKKTYTKYVQK
jgi:hypothetical protein